jgi:ATP-dependent DNA helicase RecQ
VNNPTIEIQQLLKQYFGYEKFRPMQEEIIQTVLAKKDSLVLMPTGGGKSLCYQIPALAQEGLCIVVSPLIALMKDQVEALRANGIAAAYINSTQQYAEQMEIENDCFNGKIKLLYVSPEKLVSSDFISFMKSLRLSMFAVDEAHCVSFWGHDFRPEYTNLKILKNIFPEVPIIALTATADKLTRKDIVEQLTLREPEIFIASFDRPNLTLEVRPADNRVRQIVRFIEFRPSQPGIIYCLSRKATEKLAEKLRNAGINAHHYHAQVPAPQRARVQEAFQRDDIQVVCATIAFGMGIDKSNVRWVIHYNLPKNIESYYQEIGRAGRDGAPADTVLFYSFGDVITQRSMLDELEEDRRELQMAKLDRLMQYADANICRRKILLNYFNEAMEQDCGNCDVCKNPRDLFDGTVLVQKALSAVTRTKQQVGINLLIDVLRGAHNKSVLDAGLDKIKTYGAGADISAWDWKHYIHQMINLGLLEVAYDDQQHLHLTEQSKDVLFNNKKVMLYKQEFQQKSTAARAAKPKTRQEILKDGLFEKLRQLRKQIADKENVPPYIIFNDNSLQEMAQDRPVTKWEMLEVSGVGQKKFEQYGELFIDAILQFIREENEKARIQGATHLVTLEAYKRGLDPDQIAAERNLSIVTVYSHLAALYEQQHEIDLSSMQSAAERETMREVFKKLGLDEQLKAYHEALEGKYDYSQIRLALAYYRRNGL